MTDQKAIGNLEMGTDLEVGNPEVCTKAGVDKDPEEHIELGVDPGVCNVLGVVLQNNMIPQFVLGKSHLEVAPQVVTDYLKVAPQVVTDFPILALHAVTDYLEVVD